MKQLVITPRTSTADLCAAFAAVCGLLLRRACLRTLAAVRTAEKWLKTRHSFMQDDDEEPVIMTGYQYILFAVVCCLVFMALSIKID